jgi:hypothetical protein
MINLGLFDEELERIDALDRPILNEEHCLVLSTVPSYTQCLRVHIPLFDLEAIVPYQTVGPVTLRCVLNVLLACQCWNF